MSVDDALRAVQRFAASVFENRQRSREQHWTATERFSQCYIRRNGYMHLLLQRGRLERRHVPTLDTETCPYTPSAL